MDKKIGKKKLGDYSRQELMGIFEKFIKMNLKLGPRFIIMLWFPIQMEHHKRFAKYKVAVNLAIKTRAQIEAIGPLVDAFARKVAAEIARRTKIDEGLSRFIGSHQIENYLKNNIPPEQDILLARREYFIITNDGILQENLEDYLDAHQYFLRKIDRPSVDVVKGKVAYPGMIRGVVRNIQNKDEFNKLSKGEILVTSMTTPDFLPVMKKAAAFITDEGGITCHAAIIAREMKKPCVIGTKIATQVFKDGDRVEVDAIKGIVRKIS